MAARDNILAFKARGMRVTLSDKAKRTVEESRKVAERVLPKLMNGLFEKLDDALYGMADKSGTDQLQSAYFDAMRILRKHRERIQNDFIEGVLKDFDRFWQVGPRDLSPDQNGQGEDDPDLSLLDEDELEQSLAVSNLVSKGENRYQRELYALSRRFGFLAGDVEVTSNANPLGPAGICNRFHSVIRAVEVDIPVRLVIYKLFDKQVMNHIGGLYEEINALLVRSGIMPKLASRIERGRSAPRPASAQQTGSDLDRQRGEAVFTTADVLSVVHKLTKLLTQTPSAGEGGSLAPIFHAGDDYAGLAEQLFRTLQTHPFVEPWLRRAIDRLQPLVSTDAKSFFEIPDNPLRRLFDTLEQFEIAVDAQHEIARPDLERTLGSALDSLLNLGRNDPAAVEQTLQVLKQPLERETRAYRHRVEQARRWFQAEQRKSQARARVQTDLNHRYSGSTVPEVMITLMSFGWQDLMVSAYLRENGEGTDYQLYHQVLDHLSKAGHLLSTGMGDVTAVNDAVDQAKQIIAVEQFLKGAVANDLLLNQLDELISTLDGKSAPPPLAKFPVYQIGAEDTFSLQEHVEQELAKNSHPGITPEEILELISQIQELPLGSGLIQTSGNESWLLRILDRGDGEHPSVLLADNGGFRPQRFSVVELALGLRCGAFRIDRSSERPLYDRLFKSVIEQISNAVKHDLPDLVASSDSLPDEFEALPPVETSLTIMFTDIVGYTRLMATDQQLGLRVLNQHNRLIRRLIKIHHGTEIKNMGDGFLIVHQDPEQAVTCGLSIQRELRNYNQREGLPTQIHVRIGIHHGEVLKFGGDIIGNAVNLASRLETRCEPDHICLSEGTYRLVQAKMADKPKILPGQLLKNVPQPQNLYLFAAT